MNFPPLDDSPVVFAMLFGVTISLLGLAVAVIGGFHQANESREQIPGRTIGMLVGLTATGALTGVTMIRLRWIEYMGEAPVFTAWILIGLGLFFVLYKAPNFPAKPYHVERPLGINVSVLMVVVFMATAILVSPSLATWCCGGADSELTTANHSDGSNTGKRSVQRPATKRAVARKGQLVVDVKPLQGTVNVGATVPFEVTITNNIGIGITDLKLEAAPGHTIGGREPGVFELSELPHNGFWGPVWFTTRMMNPGPRQKMELSLSYVEAGTESQMKKKGSWLGPVAGPKLKIERTFYVGSDLTVGQGVDVSLDVKNTGDAPAYSLKIKPDPTNLFEIIEQPAFPETLLAGESFVSSYKAKAVVAGGRPLEKPPIATFKDEASNDYTTSSRELVNFLCSSPRKCSKEDTIVVQEVPSDSIPALTLRRPPLLFSDQLSLRFQIPPGSNQELPLVLHHDGERDLDVRVEMGDAKAPFLSEFKRSVPVKAGDEQSVPVSFSVPQGTALGNYEASLTLSLLDSSGIVQGNPREIGILVQVTEVTISHNLSSERLNVNEPIVVNTTVTNTSNRKVKVQVEEKITTGGMSVSSVDATPACGAGGIEGQVFSQTCMLAPKAVLIRQIQLKATDAMPRKKRLTGTIRYDRGDGTLVFASDIVIFNVVLPGG